MPYGHQRHTNGAGKDQLEENVMIFDFTDHKYRTDCIDGCGSLTGWMASGRVANQVSTNHENSVSHRCIVKKRTKQED
jgi:hypothetical protein